LYGVAESSCCAFACIFIKLGRGGREEREEEKRKNLQKREINFDYNEIYVFDNHSQIDFANASTAYPAHTVKLSVRVSAWPFMGLDNSLAIVLNLPYMATVEKTEVNSTKSISCVNHQEDESGSLRWLMVSVNETSLYLLFYVLIHIFSIVESSHNT